MSIFDFNRDGEVSSSEQAFGLGAILAALSETEAEVKDNNQGLHRWR